MNRFPAQAPFPVGLERYPVLPACLVMHLRRIQPHLLLSILVMSGMVIGVRPEQLAQPHVAGPLHTLIHALARAGCMCPVPYPGTTLFFLILETHNEGWNFFTSLYFSATALTTIGYNENAEPANATSLVFTGSPAVQSILCTAWFGGGAPVANLWSEVLVLTCIMLPRSSCSFLLCRHICDGE